MKKLIILIFLITFLLLSVFKVDANRISFPLIGKMFVIDPGHGGIDNGASHLGVNEDEINLSISILLKNELENNGATVILTRDDDYDLSRPNALYRKKSDFDNRIKLINNSGADMYLSIHLNYFSQSSYYGPQVFYTNNFENNNKIAQSIQSELNKNLKTKREIKLSQSTNYMYPKLNVSGVLIECGFLSNHNERNNLKKLDYQEKIAQYITKGIINYYS